MTKDDDEGDLFERPHESQDAPHAESSQSSRPRSVPFFRIRSQSGQSGFSDNVENASQSQLSSLSLGASASRAGSAASSQQLQDLTRRSEALEADALLSFGIYAIPLVRCVCVCVLTCAMGQSMAPWQYYKKQKQKTQ